jgi:hypothetical protein
MKITTIRIIMMVMNYKISILIIPLLICKAAFSQGNTEIRSYIKTIPVSRETVLSVSNKYGTIQITQWKKDSVMIRSEIKATGSSKEKIEKMFDGVKINMTETKYQINAETSFSQNIGMIFENFKGMTSKLITYDSRVEINYYINVPDYINLRIENKYGDVYMEDNSGELSLIVSNGSFRANSISGKNANLTLTFCNADIGSLASGRIDASFSEINSGNMGEVTITSISSKYEIRKASTLRLESRRDKFNIDNISSIRGTSYFTDFRIRNLRQEASLSTRYGNVDVLKIEPAFSSINLNSGYTDISLEFEPGTSYNIDVRHQNAFLVISDKNAVTEKKVLNEDKKEYVTTGTVGKQGNNSMVSIDATHGDIYLK